MMIAEIYQWIGILVSIGCIQACLETFVMAIKYPAINQFKMKDTGLIKPHFNWMSFGFDSPGIWIVYGVKLIIAVTIFIESFGGQIHWWWPILYIIIEFLGYQRQYFLNNSDAPIQRVTLVGISIHFFYNDAFVSELVLYFISIQLCIAYFTAGWHKLKSSIWRDASVFPKIFNPYLGTKLQQYFDGTKNMKWLAWSVIGLEMGFPLSLFGGKLNQLILLSGLAFHSFISASSGINFFLWSFIACYPAVYYVGGQVYAFFVNLTL